MDNRKIVCFVCTAGVERSGRMMQMFNQFLKVHNLQSGFHVIKAGVSDKEVLGMLDKSDFVFIENTLRDSEVKEALGFIHHKGNVFRSASNTAHLKGITEAEKLSEWGNLILGKISLADAHNKKIFLQKVKPLVVRRRPKSPRLKKNTKIIRTR
ncbi:MAG: hypothetical protein WCI04_06605 [archaeon]